MTGRLSDVVLDAAGGRAPPPEIEQERKVAIFDLLEDNRFEPVGAPDGPYKLRLGLAEGRLAFALTTEAGGPAASFSLSLGPLRQVIKDYGKICTSYYEAVRSRPPAEIETLDEARRAIHGEGARTLAEGLDGKAILDEATAKRLFTLVCALGAEG